MSDRKLKAEILRDVQILYGGRTGGTGPTGDPGVGVPVGGTAGQVLAKIDGTDYNTEWATPAGGSGPILTIPIQSNAGADPALGPVTLFFR